MSSERLRALGLYFFTAGAAAAVDLAAFWCAIQLGVIVAIAAAFSFLVSSVVNYLLTTNFVFNQAARLRVYFVFLTYALVGLLINVGVTVAFVHFGLAPVIAKLGGTGCAFLANFAMNSGIVFRKPPSVIGGQDGLVSPADGDRQ